MHNKDNISAKENNSVLVLGSIFIAILILSNLAGAKIASVSGYTFNSAIIFFPITYVISDVLTEVYGFKMSRKVIWCGFIANLIVVLGLQVVLSIPHLEAWPNQQAFEVVFGVSMRIFCASIIAYLVGEYINALVMARMKISSEGKNLWYRAIGSSVIGEFIDSCIFNLISFLFVFPFKILVEIIITQYVIRIILEVAVLPITYKIVEYLKKKDNIDYYDYKTKFSIIN